MGLKLPDVTLCSVFTVCHELSYMAAYDCLKRAEFGDVKLFTDEPRGSGSTKIEKPTSVRQFAEFSHHILPTYIKTSHALHIQWDSWIINPSAWDDRFLEYDYIGAPWWYDDDYNVGNSGFCIRSKRLMDYLTEHKEEYPIGSPEDHTLCREYQRHLPQFKWAPAKLAWNFAVERTQLYPLNEVFGFHGMFRWPLVMRSDALFERLNLAKVEPYITNKPEWQETMNILRAAGIHYG